MGKGKKTNIDFSIIISLVDNSTVSKEYKMVYFQGKSKNGKTIEKRDNIQLCDNKITISGHRESSDIFYNLENNEFQTLYSSTLYKNIIKTICNYIILSKKLLFIEKININYNQFSLEFSSEEIYLFSKNEHDINIPGIETVDSDFLFSNNIKSKKFFDSFLYFV